MAQEMMIPQGHYRGRAVRESLAFGKAGTGNPQAGLSFEVTQGDYKGRLYPWYGMLVAGEAMRITLDTLEAAGVVGYEGNDIRKPIWSDVECMLVIEHRAQQEKDADGNLINVTNPDGSVKMLPSIKYVNPIGAVRMKDSLEGDELELFAMDMQGALADRASKKKTNRTSIPTGPDGKPMF